MAIPTTDHNSDAGHLEPMIQWLRENRAECGRPAIPHLRRRFGVSALDACKILRLARLRDDWPVSADDQGGANAAHS
ncbi:MAG: hypothetical protein E5V62_03020 [Mesorhizobium sp.]|uniref:hypothetical protein n=1 Tax=Mesorhizobium sp. TaxID=1871066 RepID=UPI000FD39744|nr:hypothetical protein [Mesorhizobium sp.]RVD68836.1 hypothetical protein EN751_29245 [Mesorhizobium sp. M4A.F.Ca.ET.029.04.2.1]TIW37137.1 MAG: hypothetical protein E5V62_03020 [Mesorhizobium sp.]